MLSFTSSSEKSREASSCCPIFKQGLQGIFLVLLCALYSANVVGQEKTMAITENRWNDLTPGVSTEAQVETTLGEPDTKMPNARYGSLQGLTMLAYFAQATSLYFRDGQLLLIIIAPNQVNGLSREAESWSTAFGDQMPERILDSRVDKNALLYLYVSRGLALHMVSGHVELLEIFPAMSLDTYLHQLYVPPPTFRK
jgi:hypothetical protein